MLLMGEFPASVFVLLFVLAGLPVGFAEEEVAPVQPHPLERYRSLWEEPLFEEQPTEIFRTSQPAPSNAATASFRLIGIGTVAGKPIAYVQPVRGGKVLRLQTESRGEYQLLEILSGRESQDRIVRFRKGTEILRAEFSPSSSRPRILSDHASSLPSRPLNPPPSQSPAARPSSPSKLFYRTPAKAPESANLREDYLRMHRERQQQRLAAARERAQSSANN